MEFTHQVVRMLNETCRIMADVRLSLQTPPSNTKTKKFHAWPNKGYFEYVLPKLARLDSIIVDELRRLVISKGITISDGSESAVGFAVDRDFVKMNITNENRLNHKEYKYLRNYFDLENLKYLKDRDENVPYSLTLQHRDISLEGFSLQLSNHELLDYLNKHEYRDEITWVLTYPFQGKSGLIKINYTQMKLIYEELELLPDLPIDTELKGKLRTGIKIKIA